MRIPQDYVYLDWAATTPLCEEAADAMAPYLIPGPKNIDFAANANSLHSPGRHAFSAMEEARMRVSRAISAKRPNEIIFTSGATESDNTAVLGLIEQRVKDERQRGNASYRPHFITSAIEHDAVLSLLPVLRERGCDVTVLKPDRQGRMSVQALSEALRPDTALVSIMWANNEVGTIQDIPALAACAHAAGALFHTDATQAVGKIPVSFSASGIDAAAKRHRRPIRQDGRAFRGVAPWRWARERSQERHAECHGHGRVRCRMRSCVQSGRGGAKTFERTA